MFCIKHVTLGILFPLVAVGAALIPVSGGNDDDVELDEAEVFIEYNATDGDFGIQFFWDGEPWKRMNVEGPNGQRVLRVRTRGNVRAQGMTEGFFESAEPPTSVLSMAQFLARFPEGEYEYEGRTLDGRELEGETDLTHTIPAPPANLSPADDTTVCSTSPLVVSFDAVTQDLHGNPLCPELYEVVIETEDDILKVFSIILDGDVAAPSVTVPPEFLTPGTEFKFEVIVQEDSGNRTISETVFFTN